MATEEEKSAHQKKKLSGASRQAETRIGQFTPREGVTHLWWMVASAVGEFTAAKELNIHNKDDLFQLHINLSRYCTVDVEKQPNYI